MASAKTTTNHDEIRKWVESRGGKPARVIATGRGKKNGGKTDPGILRIDFPGFSGEGTLETISWAEWFDAFDRNHLAFLYQERVRGNPSRFSKLVERKNATSGRRSAGKRAAAKRGSSKAGRSITAGNPSRGVREGSRTRATRTSGSGTTRGARGAVGRGTTRGRSSRSTSKRGRSSRAQA